MWSFVQRETGRKLKDSVWEHRRDILKKTLNKEEASHLNGPDHQGVEDMAIMGLKYVTGVRSRRLEEQKIIANYAVYWDRA